MLEIIPAILTSDLDDLKKKIKEVEQFSEIVQIDIGDGKFIPKKTIGVSDLEEIESNLFLEIHLMVSEPEKYIMPLVDLGTQRIIFHLESTQEPLKLAQKIKALNCGCGIALSPETSIERIRELDYQVDEILLLGVNPGKQGQKFQEQTISKICDIRDLYPDIIIGVDGGVNKNNINLISRSGANIAVIGSAIFDTSNPKKAYKEIIKACDET